PDARAEVGDRNGRLRELGRDVQQLHDPAGRRPHRPGRHLHPLLPPAARGADGRDHPPARSAPGRRAARVRAGGSRHVTDWTRVPGYVSHRDGPEMPTVTIETARIREACEHARDELGFNMCVDLVGTDYLGWGGAGV